MGRVNTSGPAASQPTLHTLAVGATGPRVAFLHGLFGQGRNWTQIAKGLAGPDDDGARSLLVDLPDHGRSPWSEEFSYESYADRVAETLRAAGGDDPWNVVGHSLGGKVAMVLALQHPDLVERLAVVDMAPKPYGDLSRFAGYIHGMQDLPLEELTDRADAETRFAEVESDPGVRGFLLQNLRREGDSWRWQANLELMAADEAKGTGSVIADFPDQGDRTFAGPVLWLAGGDSNYVRADDGDTMRALFPRTQLITIKGAGHWVHAEQPEAVVRALRLLLSKEARRPATDG